MATIISSNQPLFSTDDVMVDTNIWLSLFGPESIAHDDHGYGDIFYNLLDSNVHLYVNYSIISEYVNVAIRASYRSYLKSINKNSKQFDFKVHYRPTKDFKEHHSIAIRTVQQEIMQNASLIDTPSESGSKALGLAVLNAQILDFNDLIIIQDSLQHNFKILTQDADYQKYPDDELQLITK